MMKAKPDLENLKQRNLISLYRYFAWSNSLYNMYLCELTYGEVPDGKVGSPIFMAKAMMMDIGMLMCHWLGSLAVVCEGWKKLKLSDPEIDSLILQVEQLAALKRFRNGVFHYMKCYFDPRFLERLQLVNAEVWSRNLQLAFEVWFQKEFAKDYKGDSRQPH